MGKLEEVEAEKKLWESDDAWELRKAFMLAHYDDYPKIQLQCLSQLFINVTLLGCEYSQSLMQKIRSMGSGIAASKDRSKTGNYVKASAAKKRQAVKPSDLEGASEDTKRQRTEKSPTPENESFNDKLQKLKSSLAMTPHHLTGEQMMKSVTSSCLMKWYVKRVNQKIEITIDRYVAFRHTFSVSCEDANEAAMNALIESIMSCDAAVNDDGDEIRFDGVPADECYAKSVGRRLEKIKGAVTNGAHTFKGLSTFLESVNMSLKQEPTKLEGWSEQLDLIADDMLIGSRVLSSTECTKPAKASIADEMSSHVCQLILKDDIRIINSAKPNSSLALQ